LADSVGVLKPVKEGIPESGILDLVQFIRDVAGCGFESGPCGAVMSQCVFLGRALVSIERTTEFAERGDQTFSVERIADSGDREECPSEAPLRGPLVGREILPVVGEFLRFHKARNIQFVDYERAILAGVGLDLRVPSLVLRPANVDIVDGLCEDRLEKWGDGRGCVWRGATGRKNRRQFSTP
jgi:hypothetical protein